MQALWLQKVLSGAIQLPSVAHAQLARQLQRAAAQPNLRQRCQQMPHSSRWGRSARGEGGLAAAQLGLRRQLRLARRARLAPHAAQLLARRRRVGLRLLPRAQRGRLGVALDPQLNAAIVDLRDRRCEEDGQLILLPGLERELPRRGARFVDEFDAVGVDRAQCERPGLEPLARRREHDRARNAGNPL